MSDRVSFSCPSCNAALLAPVRFAGRSRNCPSCSTRVQVPPQVPEESGPLLVLDEGHARPRPTFASH